MESKLCKNPKCAAINPQPISEFKLKARYKNGRDSRCRTCTNLEHATWRLNNLERCRANGRRSYKKDPPKARSKARGCRFRQKYWPHLGYAQALAEWDRLYALQEGRCGCCNRVRPLEVEHDHLTGAVRSLACGGCNTAVARVEESFDIALAVAKYIQKHKDVC